MDPHTSPTHPQPTAALAVGDGVMVMGGKPSIRGCIGTVTCLKSDPLFVTILIPNEGKHICLVADLIPQAVTTPKTKHA